VYAVIGEDESDVETIANIVKRLAAGNQAVVKGKGFNGSGELLKRGAVQLQAYQDLRIRKFIACYDSDGLDPEEKRRELIDRVFKPANLNGACCALVPVHMIESWILADLPAIGKVIKGWAPKPGPNNPEARRNPKKHIADLSERFHKPRYNHATMNAAIAKHLDLTLVLRKCPSFAPLHAFVTEGKGNLDG
jgi:hypothetical protein